MTSSLLLPIDVETYYPWPGKGEYPQPPNLSAHQLEKRRLAHKAHPYAKDSRRCALRFITVWWDGAAYTHDTRADPVLPAWLKEALATHTLLGHNLDFDVTVLRRYGIQLSGHFIDTMLAARLLGLGKEKDALDAIEEELDDFDESGVDTAPPVGDPNFLYPDHPTDNSFGAVVRRYTGVNLPKQWGDWDWARDITDEQRRYLVDDVAHLLPTWEALEAQLREDRLLDWFMVRMEFQKRLNECKMNGIPIDLPGAQQDCLDAVGAEEDVARQLRAMFSDFQAEVPPSRRRKSRRLQVCTPGGSGSTTGVIAADPVPMEGFIPTKPEHIKAALGQRGIIVPDTKRKTLVRVDAPETRLLVRYSESRSRRTLIKGIVCNAFPEGAGWCVRAGGWNQLAARTGRIHSVAPNLQNVPGAWRRRFIASPDLVWMAADLEQIEMVLIALCYQCERLIEILSSGGDIYVHTAATLFRKLPTRQRDCKDPALYDQCVDDTLRKVAKILTLGIAYVMGKQTFLKQAENGTGIRYTLDDANNFYGAFFRMFPEIKLAHEKARREALSADAVYTVTGQRRWLPPLGNGADLDPTTGYWPSRERRARILVNTPIQGGAGAVLILAVNMIARLLPPEVLIVNLVHDEIDFLVPDHLSQAVKKLVTECFQAVFRDLYGDQLTIGVDCKIGPNWGELKSEKNELNRAGV